MLDALMSLAKFFHGRRAFTHDHVVGPDGVVGDLAFVKRGEQSAFADDEHRAAGIGFAEEIRCVERGGIEMTRGQPVNAEMIQAHGEVFRRRRRVIGEKNKRCAGGVHGRHKIRRAGNQLVLPIDDAVHINEVAGFHSNSTVGSRC